MATRYAIKRVEDEGAGIGFAVVDLSISPASLPSGYQIFAAVAPLRMTVAAAWMDQGALEMGREPAGGSMARWVAAR